MNISQNDLWILSKNKDLERIENGKWKMENGKWRMGSNTSINHLSLIINHYFIVILQAKTEIIRC